MSESAKKNYRKNKTSKRTIPVLDEKQVRKFVELLARNSSYGEIAMKLDISDIDIDILRKNLGVDTEEGIKTKLTEYAISDKESEAIADDARKEAKRLHREAEARLDQSLADREAREDIVQAKRQAELSARKDRLKSEDAERQKTHELNKKKDPVDPLASYRRPSNYYVGANLKKPVKDSAGLPKDVTAEDFRQELLSRGIRFVCDKYNISPSDIRTAITKLDLKIEFELLPR